MTTPRKHKHAALIRAWLDDDSVVIERKSGSGDWYAESTALWHIDSEYRIKPKMIKCGDLEFPEPIRAEPGITIEYWLVVISDDKPQMRFWSGSEVEKRWVKQGLCHHTKKAAEAHLRALIALTESKT